MTIGWKKKDWLRTDDVFAEHRLAAILRGPSSMNYWLGLLF